MLVIGGALIFGVVVWGAMFWGSIYLLDRENPHNRFAQALAVSVVRVGVAFVTAFGVFAALGALVIWLVLMIRILLNYYELGIGKTLGVLALMIAVPYAVSPILMEWGGESELQGALVLYGLPAGIIGGWLFLRHRAASASDSIPQARVVSTAELPAVPVVPTVPVAAMPKPPVAAPPAPVAPPAKPVAGPVAPVAPVRSSAPIAVEQASAEDGPKFLT